MNSAALLVGYAVFTAAGFALAALACALVWAFFPARWQFSRDLPSHLDTPYGPLRLTALVGLASRHKSRWFFGLMLLKEGEAPRPQVLAKKRAA